LKAKKAPRSLRSRLLTAVLVCWVLPVLGVMVLATWLLGTSYESAARLELTSRAESALEQLELRMESLFEDSKSVSYDGVVRNSYRLYQKDEDSAALYRTVTDYLNQKFNHNESVQAVFLSFWEEQDVRPYTANRADFGYQAQRRYREEVEPDLLNKVSDLDTGILLEEYGGEFYIARNLLDSHFRPYATVVLLCDQEKLFQSLDPMDPVVGYRVCLDEKMIRDEKGSLTNVLQAEPAEDGLRFEGEVSGHSIILTAFQAPFHYWNDIPQVRTAAGFIALLALPLLLVVFYWFRRHVTHPVEVLVEANNRLQDGERGYTISENAVIVLSTLSTASCRTVFPFIMEMPMLTFSARSCSVNWKSPSVPEKSRIVMSG